MCRPLSFSCRAGASLTRARTRHLHAAPIPFDRDRGCIPRSFCHLARTGQGSTRLCDRWRSRAPPEKPWVEALLYGFKASPIPRWASPRGMVKRPWLLNGLEKRGGGGGRQGRPWRGGLVTKIVDRRQRAVMRAAWQAPRLQVRAHRCAAEAQGRRGARRPLAGTSNIAPTPCRVLHRQTLCSVLELSPLLHPTASAALSRTSPAAATDRTGVALNRGVGGTPWAQMREEQVTKIVRSRQHRSVPEKSSS